ncbi:MAG: hypothetical protein NZ960_01820 [Candidatus Kapabacteria bacterium]|nr:hypothetical protein [Candidatus Kapabacteria bacterium]MDW8011763.1 hypothetical protein [Bacteroidota bacterium]
MESQLYIFSPENVLRQMETAEYRQGYYILRFYVDERGMPARYPTGRTAIFYLSPSGGILRDSSFNIVLYSPKFDIHKGYGRLNEAEE